MSSPLTPMPVPPSLAELDDMIKAELREYLAERGVTSIKSRERLDVHLERARAARAAHILEYGEHTRRLMVACLRAELPERDVLPPGSGRATGDATTGWDYNVAGRRVFKGWSRHSSHGTGDPPTSRYGGGSQRSRALYSTRELALQALTIEATRVLLRQLGELGR